jgi:hypothetical protein
MEKSQYNIVTLKPKWSVKDMFVGRNEEINRERILHQLNSEYLSQGWELAEDIMWGKDFGYAVMKLGRFSSN